MQGEDETALEILYNRYAGLIFTLALRIVGDPELAREVLQDTFLRCWDGRETYDVGRGRVPWWLMGIARNRAIDLLRSRPHQARLREREPLAVVIAKATQPDVTDSLPMRHAVVSALQSLPIAQRQAIELAYYGGFTQTEIAHELGAPLGTITLAGTIPGCRRRTPPRARSGVASGRSLGCDPSGSRAAPTQGSRAGENQGTA